LRNMKNSEFILKLSETIARFQLLEPGDRVLVAVSGGPDSVALLHGLLALKNELNLHLVVAHLNHKLRGIESDEDEQFVKTLASRLKIPFFSKRVDVKREAKRRKLSIEECAREVRYEYLQKLADKVNADRIATGHQADDQAETFLMRLIRGAGGTGLSGIPAKRGKIIRPLIHTKREEIERFLRTNQITYRVDPSNYLTDHFRNRVRLSLLPKLKQEYNPQIVEVLNRTADIISCQQEHIEKKCEEILQAIANMGRRRIVIRSNRFALYDGCLQRQMIRLCVRELKGDLNQLGFEPVERTLDLVSRKKSGRKVKLTGKIWMEIGGGELVISEAETGEHDYPLSLPGGTNLADWGIKIRSRILERKSIRLDIIVEDQNVAMLDWEKLKSPFRLRSVRNGDRFTPLGMKGTKTLADFLIDAKVPHHRRDEVPILTSKGRIVWVVGFRISDEFKVTDQTKKVLKLQVTNE
jgi:tRNA(Ile)-lysidine synthase